MAINNIIDYKGNQTGKSIKEDNCEEIIKEIFETAKNYSCKITFPEDVLVENMDDNLIKELKDIQDDDLILDIGPKTINKIKNIIKISETSSMEWTGRLFREFKFC